MIMENKNLLSAKTDRNERSNFVSEMNDMSGMASANLTMSLLSEANVRAVFSVKDGMVTAALTGLSGKSGQDSECHEASGQMEVQSIEEILKKFSLSGSDYEDFKRNGSAYIRFTDTDDNNRVWKIQKLNDTADGNVSGCVIEVDANRKPEVSIRTFGRFEIFVDNEPVWFHSKKSKELLALMVERRGGFLTRDEGISYLWEDIPVTENVKSNYRKVLLRLKQSLREYGIDYILKGKRGAERIDVDAVSCDLYQYLDGKPEDLNQFRGQYMTDYSWAEEMLANLLKDRGFLSGNAGN